MIFTGSDAYAFDGCLAASLGGPDARGVRGQVLQLAACGGVAAGLARRGSAERAWVPLGGGASGVEVEGSHEALRRAW